MRKIAVISGKYGGFRAMVPMLRLFDADPQWDMQVYLTDQHLWKSRGQTTREARRLVKEARVVGCATIGRERALFHALSIVADGWKTDRPDVVVVYGDRLDALLGAALAHELGVPVAHLQAGDKSGGTDDTRRLAVSALSKYLFCPTDSADRRCTNYWIHTQHIYTVGDHHLDAVFEIAAQPMTFPPGFSLIPPYYVVHMHPDTLATPEENRRVCDMMWVEMAGHVANGARIYVMPPCNDRMHEVIEAATPDWPAITRLKHLPLERYVPLLMGSMALWGNTSAILIDAPALKVETRLFGNRQIGRELEYRGDGTAGQQTYEILNAEVPND